MTNVYSLAKKYALTIALPTLMVILLMSLSPETRSWAAVRSLLMQGFAPAILGWGVLFNMKVGNWDFSIGARVILATIIAGNIAVYYSLGVLGFAVLCIALSLLLGLIVGYAYLLLNIPTMIVSIGLLLIFESLTRILFGGIGMRFDLSYMILGRFPNNLIVFVACFAVASFLYYKRKYGYNVRAVGSNPIVAQTNGIDARKTKATAIVISGLFAGLFSILHTSITGVRPAVAGTMGSMGIVFDAMMCVLIGMSISGKGGSVIVAIYAGAVCTQILNMGMMAIGIPTAFSMVVIGVFVVLLMIASSRSDVIKKIGTKFRLNNHSQ